MTVIYFPQTKYTIYFVVGLGASYYKVDLISLKISYYFSETADSIIEENPWRGHCLIKMIPHKIVLILQLISLCNNFIK